MTILDTFYTLFKADTTQLDKGLEESERKSKETAAALTATDVAARRLGESIGRTIRELGGFALGYLAVQSLRESFVEAVNAADKLDETAERLDLNIEMLSAYGDAVKLAGGDTVGFASSIDNLNTALTTMEVTGKSRAAPFLKELGIDLDNVKFKGKNAFELFPAIADAMAGMSKAQSTSIGKKLGLDLGTIMLLQKGSVEIEQIIKRQRELGVVTKEQGEIAAKFNDQIDDTRHAFRSLWLAISTAVLPAFTWLIKKFEEVATFIRTNKDFIVGLMIAIGGAIAVYALPPLIAMAAAALAAAAPFLLLAAIVAALAVGFALLYDDIVNFLNKNDSLIGQLLEKYPQLRAVLEGVGAVFEWIGQTASDVAQIILQVFTLTFDAIYQLIAGVFGFWVEKLSGVGEVFKAIGALIAGIVSYWIDLIGQFLDKFGGIVGIAKSVGGAISGALGAAKSALGLPTAPPGLAQGQQQLATAGAAAINSQTSGSIANGRTSNRNTQVNVENVNVQTQATDAAGISKSIGDSLGDQMRQTASNFDDGVII